MSACRRNKELKISSNTTYDDAESLVQQLPASVIGLTVVCQLACVFGYLNPVAVGAASRETNAARGREGWKRKRGRGGNRRKGRISKENPTFHRYYVTDITVHEIIQQSLMASMASNQIYF